MAGDLEKSKRSFSDLLKFDFDEDLICKQLLDILNACMKVDN
jgi:hypothetical protein